MAAALPPGQFHGTLRRTERVAGLLLTERAYAPGTVLPRHAHALPYLRLICRGGLEETDGRRTRRCRPLSVVFRAPDEAHEEHIDTTGARSLIVEFGPRFLERVRGFSTVLDAPAVFDGGPVPALALKLYQEFLRDDEVSPLGIEGAALEVVAAAARRAPMPPPRAQAWVEQVAEILQARFTEPLSLSFLASAVGVHPVHLARSFRAARGCSVGEYLRALRVDFAHRELLRTTAPLSEIALAAGFCDQSHFSREFKRHTGITPAQARASRAR
jgi:AraC family transcriptional regulator